MSETLFTSPTTFEPHPDLARVMLVEAVAKHLAANHHGDAGRKEAASDLADEWNAFLDSIREHGVIEPVKVLEGTHYVVDGRNRLSGAQQLGKEVIPYQTVTKEQADKIIEATVAGRRHWTKSMRAYFAVLRHPEVANEKAAAERQKAGGPAQNAGGSPAELATRFGVSLRLMEQAIQVYRELEKKPRVRETIEPSIWAGMSLGGILSGIGGAEKTAGKNKPAASPSAVAKVLATFKGQMSAWQTWDAVARDAFADEFAVTWKAIPAEARSAMLEVIEECAVEA